MQETTSQTVSAASDDEYERFEATVRTLVASLATPLFQTDADPEALWAAYLDNLSQDRRQHYACSCCRRFGLPHEKRTLS